MDRKLGGLCPFGAAGRGAGSPSNTMCLGPRPTCTLSFILTHPTVWPQCTNVTDRQHRQRTDSIGRAVLQTVTQLTFNELLGKRVDCQHATNNTSPLCTLSQSRNTSSFPVHEPPTLSMRQIFKSAAHGASVEHAKQSKRAPL